MKAAATEAHEKAAVQETQQQLEIERLQAEVSRLTTRLSVAEKGQAKHREAQRAWEGDVDALRHAHNEVSHWWSRLKRDACVEPGKSHTAGVSGIAHSTHKEGAVAQLPSHGGPGRVAQLQVA